MQRGLHYALEVVPNGVKLLDLVLFLIFIVIKMKKKTFLDLRSGRRKLRFW